MFKSSKLDFYRQRIDRLDDRLFALLKQRFDAVDRLKAKKQLLGMPLFDSAREKALIARAIGKKTWSRKFVQAIYGAIFAESHRRLKNRKSGDKY